jgi:hypothetical protein
MACNNIEILDQLRMLNRMECWSSFSYEGKPISNMWDKFVAEWEYNTEATFHIRLLK